MSFASTPVRGCAVVHRAREESVTLKIENVGLDPPSDRPVNALSSAGGPEGGGAGSAPIASKLETTKNIESAMV